MQFLKSKRIVRRGKRARANCRALRYESLESRDLLAVVSITPTKDNTLYQTTAYGTVSDGSGPELGVGIEHFDAQAMRAAVAFDVAGSIPAGSTINSVTLTMNVSLTFPGASATTEELHKLTSNWGEGTSKPSGFMPPFNVATTNDTTWTKSFYPNTSWTTAGGDFVSTSSGSKLVSSAGSYTWSSTSQMVADVQSWLNSPTTNFGWIIKDSENHATVTGVLFDSREASVAANRPTLSINYTAPAAPPDLTISSNHTGNFRQGDVADVYSVSVTNAGPSASSGQVTVTDTLPAGLTPVSAIGSGWSVSIAGQKITATRSDALAAGNSYPALLVTVSVAANAPASITHAPVVSGGSETNTANDTGSDVTSITQVSDLTIAATHTTSFRQGDSADNYSIIVTNSAGGATSGLVTVTDTLPTGLTPTAASGTGWTTSISGSVVTATRSDALAGGGVFPPITITVSVANNANSSVTNAVTVAGGGDSNPNNNSATDPTTIAQVADLIVAASHIGDFYQGDIGDVYSIKVANAGLAATVGLVTVTDTLPAGITPTTASGSGWTTSIVGQTVTATRSDVLVVAASYPTLVIHVNVASNASANLINVATVAGGGELNTANDSSSNPTVVLVAAPDLSLATTAVGNFTQGDTLDSYTIVVSNTGPLGTTGLVTVTDTLPTGLTVTAATGSGWSTSVAGQIVTATRSDSLGTGGSYPALTVTVQVANNAPPLVNNVTTVAGGGDVNNANNSATTPTAIAQLPDLTIGLSHAGQFHFGQAAADYTLVVSNGGLSSTTGQVTVTDTIPAGVLFVSASGNGWNTSITGATVTAIRSDVLAAGASYPALTITVSVPSVAPTSVTNVAHVSGGGELILANDDANDPTSISSVPINNPPSFVKGADQQSTDESAAQSITAWAISISPGPPSEATQAVSFIVTNDNNSLFTVQPTIDSAGNASFTPKPNSHGTATVTVKLQDNGGTANGGNDTSAPQSFTITVTKAHLEHNAAVSMDVDADGAIAPIDALIIINLLNSTNPATTIGPGSPAGPPYYDVNADGSVAPIDALIVINQLNGASGEGESPSLATTAAILVANNGMKPSLAEVSIPLANVDPSPTSSDPTVAADANPSIVPGPVAQLDNLPKITAKTAFISTSFDSLSAANIDAILQQPGDWLSP